ncbi:Mov34/MPN/PAD-1 family protein [Streptomyces sp. NPDC047000]|uniref:caspase, EACC1-associated type n=1 Tax=Streptomyces sp. NPDC047000 TaxID=3155474 RepID=UPI0033FF12D2
MSKGGRFALLIGTKTYDHPGLGGLRSPMADVDGLAEVLGDPYIGGYQVSSVVDAPHQEATTAVESFFIDRSRDDFLLLHMSCHGIKDDDGELFFATRGTRRRLLDSTTVSAEFLRRQIRKCRAKSIVLLLDCCYSGAFMRGRKGDTTVHLRDALTGDGTVVLTASNEIEYAWEDDRLSELDPRPSLFTGAVIEGLRSGEADLDRDGVVSEKDLYQYVCERMHAARPDQSPRLWGEIHYRLTVARSARGRREWLRRPQLLGGRYEMGELLGREGICEVHRGYDRHRHRAVAVRSLLPDLVLNPSFQARFREESRSAAALRHPGIVAVHDRLQHRFGQVSVPYTVTEYVDGPTLRELLDSGHRPDPGTALGWTAGILRTLEYAHAEGAVHGDIRPANVLLDRDSQVRITGFGSVGGPDTGTDLYATGCLLYELLALVPPFDGRPPSAFDPRIPPGTDRVVLKALDTDPARRYRSAHVMRADIERERDACTGSGRGHGLVIGQSVHDAIVAHARAQYPLMACGLVVGPAGHGRPERHIPMRNAAASRTFYEMDGQDVVNVYRSMDERDEEVVVIYHSNIDTEAYPSRTDISYANEPGAHYVIVSLADPENVEFRSFRIVEGEVFEDGISIVPSDPSV